MLISYDAGNGRDTIFFGHHPSATHGRDTSLCERELPPLPPSGIFDFRFLNPPGYEGQQPPTGFGQGFYHDYRRQTSPTQIDTHRVHFQPTASGYPITFTWSPASVLAMCDSAWLMDEFGGSFFKARMQVVSSLAVTNPAITSLLIVKFGTVETPSTPSLGSPANGATGQPTTLLLSWNAASQAITYRVQVATDAGFTAPVVDDASVTTTSRSVGPLLTGTTYYWRVSASNNSGTSSYSSVRTFTTTSLPSAPVLVSPTDGATNQATTLTLSWNAVPTAITYRVQVATDAGFTSLVVNDASVASTSRSTGPLAAGTLFYWRVSATNGFGEGAYSVARSFTTLAQPSAPTLLSPSDGATNQALTLLLSWNAVPTAVTYRVQVATDAGFTALVVDDAAVSSTSRSVGTLAVGTLHYWRVDASNGSGTGAYSAVRTFTTVAVPSVPILVSPPDGATGQASSLTLDWNASSGAPTYRLQLSTDSLFLTTLVDDSTLAGTSYAAGPLAEVTRFYWRVNAKNGAGTSAWSSAWDFTTGGSVTNQYPVASGWNLVSVPLTVNSLLKTDIFPTAISFAYSFGSSGYTREDTLRYGVGYWLKFDSNQNIGITGFARTTDTINVNTGWNLIGTISANVDTSEILEIPSGLVRSSYFGYSGGYAAAVTLVSGRAYWVKAGSAGQLVLPPAILNDRKATPLR